MALLVAVKKPATMSSVRKPDYHRASNAVDNVTVCPTGLSTAHTDHEFSPWIKIDLLDIYDLNSVVIYNRQDYFGKYTNILDHLSLSGAFWSKCASVVFCRRP
mgnify:CR=1 FL=1